MISRNTDSEGRPVEVSVYEADEAGVEREPVLQATLSYDPNGRLREIQNAAEVTTRFSYLAAQSPRLITHVSRDHRHDEFLYRANGEALGHCPAGTNPRESLRGCEVQLYDSQTKTVRYLRGAGRVIEYRYNETGALERWTLRATLDGPELERHNYIYNDSGQLIERSWSGEVISEVDQIGEPIEPTELEARELFELNEEGQLITARDETDRPLIRFEWEGNCGSPSRYCDRADLCYDLIYDSDCQLSERHAPDGSVDRYAYVDNQLERIEDSMGQVWRFTKEEGGSRLVYTSPTGHETRRLYDTFGRLSAIQSGDEQEITYHYDERAQLSSLSAGNERIEIEYDSQGRLNYAMGPDGAMALNWSSSGQPLSVYYTGGEGDEPLALRYTPQEEGGLSRGDWQPAIVSDSLGGQVTQRIGPHQLPVYLNLTDVKESKHMGAKLLFYVADHLEGVDRHTSGTGELSDTPFPDLAPSFGDSVNTFLGTALCTIGLVAGAAALGI